MLKIPIIVKEIVIASKKDRPWGIWCHFRPRQVATGWDGEGGWTLISQPLIAPAGEQIQRHARHPAAAYGMVVSCVWRSESVGHVSLDL